MPSGRKLIECLSKPSGIGPKAHLNDFGIKVVKDAPGVGSYLVGAFFLQLSLLVIDRELLGRSYRSQCDMGSTRRGLSSHRIQQAFEGALAPPPIYCLW